MRASTRRDVGTEVEAATRRRPMAPPVAATDRRPRPLPLAAGNQAVLRYLQRAQPKLIVGSASDGCEKEADEVARRVVDALGSDGTATYADTTSGPARVSRAPVVGAAGGQPGADVEQGIQASMSGGRSLPDTTRSGMETAFGADFAGVRVHTGPRVDRLNDDLQSRAFTLGPHVFVHRSDYHPGTRGGDQLLAHELTHTLQQGGASVRRSSTEPVVRVTGRAPHGLVSLKRGKMHLDFVRMKRDDTRLGKSFQKKMANLTGPDWLKPTNDPNDPRMTDSYGH